MSFKDKIKTEAIYEAVKSFTHEKFTIRRAILIRLIVAKLIGLKEEGKMKSWETTISGVATILVAVGGALKVIFDGDPATNVDFATLAAAITAGIGLIRARDNNVSSEQAGIK